MFWNALRRAPWWSWLAWAICMGGGIYIGLHLPR